MADTIAMKKKQHLAYLLLYNFLYLAISAGGWLWEMLIYLATRRQFVNRGFLHGPWLPVYGTGAVLLSLLFYHGKLNRKISRRINPSTPSTPRIHFQNAPADPVPTGGFCAKSLRRGGRPWLPAKTMLARAGASLRPPQKITESLAIFLLCAAGGGLVEYMTGWLLLHVFQTRYWDYTGAIGSVGGYICLFSILGFGAFGLLWLRLLAPRIIRLWERISFPVQILLTGVLDTAFLTDVIFSLLLPNTGKNITF